MYEFAKSRAVHSVLTFFVGLAFMGFGDLTNAIAKSVLNTNDSKDVVRLWMLTSLYHDWGYYSEYTQNCSAINVYNINGDFDINIRVEGAYNPYWREPENFVDYYNYPDITTHGNCESFIGNDLIVSARFSRGVMVGYSIIRENNLTASGPHDLVSNTTKKEFSAYRAKSKFLTESSNSFLTVSSLSSYVIALGVAPNCSAR